MLDASKIVFSGGPKKAIPIEVVSRDEWVKTAGKRDQSMTQWAAAHEFSGKPLSILAVPDRQGQVARIVVGAPSDDADPFALGAIASRLPPGHYRFETPPGHIERVALGWCLELYLYDPYRKTTPKPVTLALPRATDVKRVVAVANAVFAVRDQVNTPANLFGPDELEKVARTLAKTHGAKLNVTRGEALEKHFPLVHAVGVGSARAPRLLDFIWGSPRHPKVTLVGKGVCFDTGGLDIKPPAGMLQMKKDMGGAANVLGLARLIMEAKLNLRLRVLIPAVENSISGVAFRPGDVFKSRKGLTVEIGNTDAEGRLVLADALALADEEKPDILVDMATLTGAARVALGPDLPPFYTDDNGLAAEIARHATDTNDPLWRLPLWRPYSALIETPIADLNNSGQGGFAGSITAALFLRRFVEHAKSYVHFDIFAWTPTAKPGRPKGGEAQAMRAMFALLSERYGN